MENPTDWPAQVSAALDAAFEDLQGERLEACEAHINLAFDLIDDAGALEHPMFASVLCMAGDLAMTIGETRSAGAMYQRAATVLRPYGKPAAIHLAKALCGLAASDVERGRVPEAREGFTEALAALDASDEEAARAGREVIAQALASLPPE